MKKTLLIELLLPVFFSICVSFGLIYLHFDHNASRFEKILDGSITFTSIVVGFLSALLGVIISIRDSEITKRVFDVREKSLLVHYFLETILLGFLVIICSGTLYVFIGLITTTSFVITRIWSLLLFWFIPSSVRIIGVMMLILFKVNVTSSRPPSEKLSEEERAHIRSKFTKKREEEK